MIVSTLKDFVSLLAAPRVIRKYLRDKALAARLVKRWPILLTSLPSSFWFDDHADLTVGAGSTLGAFSEIVITPADKFNEVPGGLRIGENSHIGSHANIRATGGRIDIGDKVIIAQQVSLVASNHSMLPDIPFQDQKWDTTRLHISIQNNVWIGAGCIVLPGVTIHEGAVVAAGAVVTASIPVNELWGGIPARCLRSLKSES